MNILFTCAGRRVSLLGNFRAAMITIRPSPLPTSNIFSPAFNPPSRSIFSTIASGVG